MNEKFILEKIAFYKLWLTFIVAIDASITAWFFNNADKTSFFKLVIVTLAILLITLVIIILTQKSRRMIKRLEEQK